MSYAPRDAYFITQRTLRDISVFVENIERLDGKLFAIFNAKGECQSILTLHSLYFYEECLILRRDLNQIVKLYMRVTFLASVESRCKENANVLHSSPSTSNFNQL